MSWLRRRRGVRSAEDAARRDEGADLPPGTAPPEPPSVEGAAPGHAQLFEGARADGKHRLLDLGPGSGAKLALYTPYARRLRFLDLLSNGAPPPGVPALLRGTSPPAGGAFDLVLAWDVLDWIEPAHRPAFMASLDEITGPGARIHLLVRAPDRAPPGRLAFAPLALDRMRYVTLEGPAPPHPPIQSAQVGRILEPFQVVRAFTLKVGFKGFVAVKG
jgi:hypothetical protein